MVIAVLRVSAAATTTATAARHCWRVMVSLSATCEQQTKKGLVEAKNSNPKRIYVDNTDVCMYAESVSMPGFLVSGSAEIDIPSDYESFAIVLHTSLYIRSRALARACVYMCRNERARSLSRDL